MQDASIDFDFVGNIVQHPLGINKLPSFSSPTETNRSRPKDCELYSLSDIVSRQQSTVSEFGFLGRNQPRRKRNEWNVSQEKIRADRIIDN